MASAAEILIGFYGRNVDVVSGSRNLGEAVSKDNSLKYVNSVVDFAKVAGFYLQLFDKTVPGLGLGANLSQLSLALAEIDSARDQGKEITLAPLLTTVTSIGDILGDFALKRGAMSLQPQVVTAGLIIKGLTTTLGYVSVALGDTVIVPARQPLPNADPSPTIDPETGVATLPVVTVTGYSPLNITDADGNPVISLGRGSDDGFGGFTLYGKDPVTGAPLTLNFDTAVSPDGGRFATLEIQDTDRNRVGSITVDQQEAGRQRFVIAGGSGQPIETTDVQSFSDGHTEYRIADGEGRPTGLVIVTPGGYNTEVTESYRFENGEPILDSRNVVEYFYDDAGVSRIETATLADGQVIRSTYDSDGNLYSQQIVPSTAQRIFGAINEYGGNLIDSLSLLQAIKTGQPLPITTTALRVAMDLSDAKDASYYELSGAANVGSGILSLMSLNSALERGDTIAAVNAGAQAISFGARAYADFATSQVFSDWSAGTFDLAAESAALEASAFSSAIGEALPYLSLVNSIAHGDEVGAAVAIISMACPAVGIAYSVYSLVTTLFSDNSIPDPWGSSHFAWSGNSIQVQSAGETGGREAVDGVMTGVLATLNSLIAQQITTNPGSALGLIPERMPSMGYDMSGYRFTNIDPLTGVEKNPGLRYDTAGRPYNAEPGSPESYMSLGEAMVRSAIARGAIAPEWEVQTARMQHDAGDPRAGLTEEERAGRDGRLAPALTGLTQVFRPVALDLDSDGIETVGKAQSGVAFDVDDSGFLKGTGWVKGDDAFLVLDRNYNGQIDAGREMLSNGKVDVSRKGLAGMAWMDANYDGKLTADDPVWDELQIWQDRDGDGTQDAGEVSGLTALGVSELNYSMSRFVQNGVIKQMGSPDLEADAQGTRINVVPEGIVIQTSDGSTSLLVTRIDDQTAVQANQDGLTGYEDIEAIVNGIDLMANDKLGGFTGRDLTIKSVGNFRHGTGFLDGNGFVHFIPEANYFGTEAGFDYVTEASNGQQGTGTVNVTLNGINDLPTLEDVNHATRPVYGYTPVQYDPDYGTYQSGGNPIYEPYYTYEYQDGSSPAATYHGTPVAYEDTGAGKIIGTDIDDPKSSLSYALVSQPQYGSVTVNPDGTFQYTSWKEPGIPSDHIVVNGQYAGTHGGTLYYPGNLPSQAVYPASDVFQVQITDPSGGVKYESITVPHYGPYLPPTPPGGGGGKKPISVDLDGNGFGFQNVDDSNVFLDVNGDGWKERTSWVAPGDGLLAMDANGNGKIDHINEISFAQYKHGAQTDLEGLSAFDSNGDGMLTAADDVWNKLGIWQDANQNGVTDPGEFRSLEAVGVTAISLTSDGEFRVVDGQTIHGVANMYLADGRKLDMADVTLAYNNETQVLNPDGTTSTVTRSPFSPDGEVLDGTADNDLLVGKTGNNVVNGYGGDDVVMEGGGNDTIDGGSGNDLIYSGGDNDIVMAGTGDDVVYAGLGNDVVFGGDGDDVILAESGNDIAFGGDGNDLVSGGLGSDVLSGDDGDDEVYGEQGNDALFGRDGNDVLGGMAGYDRLDGGAGNDTLDGGSEADLMVGGAGDDTYVVDDAADAVQEVAGEGVDTVRSSISYALGSNVENLTLTGSGNLSGTGNELDNVLTGNNGNNQLSGGAGNDTLAGGLGEDRMAGGTGDDTYVVNSAGDQVVENAGEGIDTVRSTISYTLGDTLEKLTLLGNAYLTGTGNAGDNVLTGNRGNNRLDGGAGADQMAGGLGDDTYVVDNAADTVAEGADAGYDTIETYVSYVLPENVEEMVLAGNGNIDSDGNDLGNVLIGNSGNNRLRSLGGNDIIDGRGGADIMEGGVGDDTYYVENIGDQVIEAPAAGDDLVYSTISYVLPENVERLTLTGGDSINGTGNEMDNTLTGNIGNNRLDGGAGADQLSGGAGDDTYVVDNAGDTVIEASAAGYDTVESSVSYVLPENVERLILTGNQNIAGTGNDLDNVIIGNGGDNALAGQGGDDTLNGQGGNDALDGGEGDDTYVWARGDALDRITDVSGQDVLQFGAGLTVDNLALRVTAANGVYTAHIRALDANGCEIEGEGLDFAVTRNAAGGFVAPVEQFRLADGTVLSFDDLLIKTVITGDPKRGDWFHVDDWRDESNRVVNPMGKFDFADASSQTLGQFIDAAREKAHRHDWHDDDAHGRGWTGWSEWHHGDWREWRGRPGSTTSNVVTGRNDDVIFATSGMDTVHAGTGNDVIFGREGADALYGEGGNDAIFGSSGADVMEGGHGYDILIGGRGDDVLRDAGHNNLLLGGSGNDRIEAGDGNDFIAGGRDNDTLQTGGGRNVVAFDRNDGKDTILASAGAQNTLTLGSDIGYDDMALSRQGNDLVLDLKRGDAVTFKDWYGDAANRNFVTLQILDESREWHQRHDWHGRNPYGDNRVETFDFQKLVSRFDAVAATGVTRWNLMNGLLDAHIGSGEDAAIGGEFAFQYSRTSDVRDLGISVAQDVMQDPAFGAVQQGLEADKRRGGC